MIVLAHQAVHRVAAEAPDRVAIIADSTTMTYQDLSAAVRTAGGSLHDAGVRPGDRVAVAVADRPGAIVCILAVLAIGATCVPVDPSYPAARRLMMLEDAKVSYVVADGEPAGPPAPGAPHILEPNRLLDGSADGSARGVEPAPDGLAYILFTSGSSGRPKGVLIDHEALYDVARKTAELFQLTPSDRLLQFASVSFAASMGQIFGPLTAGATLVLRTRQYSAKQIIRYAAEHQVTVLWVTPTVLSYLVRSEEPSAADLTSLRLVRSGGEALTAELLTKWFAKSSVPVMNVYGPTEAVQDITARTFVDASAQVTIGTPLFDAQIAILDSDQKPAAAGADGELYFATPGMARGYLDDPVLTAQRFPQLTVGGDSLRYYRTGDVVRRLDNGELEYRGRWDNQVKIQGYRIELEEVEACLLTHPEIDTAAVVIVQNEAGVARLIAFYVAAHADPVAGSSLLSWCTERLPIQSVPAQYIEVPRLPLSPNGKLDRKALARDFGEGRASYSRG
ncbi:amino acid adenylation domain-containing protein [Kribbella sp. NPDC056345]|uniref:amino acid adenylation domain-containing protein n=1 Tax=Kribbella sp. NPDC056345 TaxID=3345789 RepID=UPI0035D82823